MIPSTIRAMISPKTLILASLLAISSSSFAQDRLPEVSLQDVNGERIDLSTYAGKGKITVLNLLLLLALRLLLAILLKVIEQPFLFVQLVRPRLSVVHEKQLVEIFVGNAM